MTKYNGQEIENEDWPGVVMISTKKYSVSLMVILAALFFVGEAFAGHIVGNVMSREGKPVIEGTVLFYSDALGPPPDINKYMRTPENIAQTDRHGNFKAELPEGKYYIGAMKHLSGKWGGPPREGDTFFISREADNSLRPYEVQKDKPLDIGSITEPEPVEKVEGIGEVTAVEGVIYDMHGNPFEDVVVFAYIGSIYEKGLTYVSDYTLADGRYVLRVAEGGKYSVMVMGKFGSLFPGAEMIITDDGKNVSGNISVSTGEVNNNVDMKIIILVEK